MGLVGVDINLRVVPRSPRSFLPSESLALFQTLQILHRLAIMHFIFANTTQFALVCVSRVEVGQGAWLQFFARAPYYIDYQFASEHVNYDCLLHTSYVLVGQITFSLHAWSLILSSINHIPHTCMYMYYYISLYFIQLEWAAFIYPSHM